MGMLKSESFRRRSGETASADSESPLSPAHPPSESGSPPLRSDEERESPKYDPSGLEERLEARRDAEADEKMELDPFNVAGEKGNDGDQKEEKGCEISTKAEGEEREEGVEKEDPLSEEGVDGESVERRNTIKGEEGAEDRLGKEDLLEEE